MPSSHGTRPGRFAQVLEKYRAVFTDDEISTETGLDGSWKISTTRAAWFRVMDGEPEHRKAMRWLRDFHGIP
jgi:transposase-like protein